MVDYPNQLKRILKKVALGYERNLDFSYGWINALYVNCLISKKEYNQLIKQFATPE
jgi:hypothetical protein